MMKTMIGLLIWMCPYVTAVHRTQWIVPMIRIRKNSLSATRLRLDWTTSKDEFGSSRDRLAGARIWDYSTITDLYWQNQSLQKYGARVSPWLARWRATKLTKPRTNWRTGKFVRQMDIKWVRKFSKRLSYDFKSFSGPVRCLLPI